MNRNQSYQNHIHYVPLYHYLTFAAMLILIVGTLYNLITCQNEKLEASILLLLVFTVISVSFHNRSFALKVQDRAVRAEENFRYFVLTGTRLPNTLSISQIIALRFASDEEFIELVEKTLRENLKPKEIKKAIKTWKPDYYRA